MKITEVRFLLDHNVQQHLSKMQEEPLQLVLESFLKINL